MPIKKYTTEQIIGLLRDAEILLAEGNTIAMTSKKLGISEQTYYRWRKEYGGMKVQHAKRLKDLEKENNRLKKLLAEAELDKAILKEAASGNF
jgi:putative transposase